MLKRACGKLTLVALLGMTYAVAISVKHASADVLRTRQTIVTASRNVSPARDGFRPFHHVFRRERAARRHFHGPRAIGIDGGAVAIPVPETEGEQPYPIEQPFDGFDYRPWRGPPVSVGPQIITLPDPLPGERRAPRVGTVPRAASAGPRFHAAREPSPRPRVIAFRYPSPYRRPVCWPGYTEEFVAIALPPCDDPPHSAIYNTPCGVRPFE